jgi:plasmid stabilization system protein ParE
VSAFRLSPLAISDLEKILRVLHGARDLRAVMGYP